MPGQIGLWCHLRAVRHTPPRHLHSSGPCSPAPVHRSHRGTDPCTRGQYCGASAGVPYLTLSALCIPACQTEGGGIFRKEAAVTCSLTSRPSRAARLRPILKH
ncbi:hypothetical protein GDO81_023317 [Engystomops pustulosus]|uniref:Uncharacterized protein n=1 Tax=Engystomops pustulosus TaxID=76066 RepID=A0AAV6YKX2_ENGPU|nr:hypothetical protein GDO81_023317 [Engystomops pustulosus]